MKSIVWLAVLCFIAGIADADNQSTTQPATVSASSINIQVPVSSQADNPPERRFTVCYTAEDLQNLISNHPTLLPLAFQFQDAKNKFIDALNRINMGALIERLMPFFEKRYPNSFDPANDLIIRAVPENKQVEIKDAKLPNGSYRGPRNEIAGFLMHNLTKDDFITIAIRIIHTARQMLQRGNPEYDRSSPEFYRTLAEKEVEKLKRSLYQKQQEQERKENIRIKIAKALGIYNPQTGEISGQGDWVKESRRFSYVVQEGDFISRLKPLVDQMNYELSVAGFSPPEDFGRAGIYFDSDLKDVEIVLPRKMMQKFLEQADHLERRMAEDHMISIEAIRLTDREIIDGALASRLNVLSQGVHNVKRFNVRGVLKQVGINALLAVANRELQVQNLRDIQSGAIPEGSPAVQIPSIELPPLITERQSTNVGGNFSVGADDIFFDGREQSYGFHYVGPDGVEHTLSLDVVDSLREFWDRIERNLIVHKIKKTDKLVKFSVPVGPETKTFEGIAALISQENRDIVVTSKEGALIQLSATAGTWLIIQNFTIEPIPGSSTSLTQQEQKEIENRVLMVMFLRDPAIELETKYKLIGAKSREELEQMLEKLYSRYKDKPIKTGLSRRTYQTIFQQRKIESIKDASIEKKEKNSKIKMSFYSSQGNIIQQPGITELGDANDLTSFTTELRPNIVTPISSFFTKTSSGSKGTSPLTGISKGEQTSDEKTMAHLMVRVRFPTLEREKHDLEEGRYLGYFNLPFGRIPHSSVNLPFLSSSEHPLQRLASLRVGLMFETLQQDKIRRPFDLNPNNLQGTIPLDVWETATTRLLCCWKIINDSPTSKESLESQFRRRFVIAVRTLLEYDEDFFNAPNIALRNMSHWNDANRIIRALNNNTRKFSLEYLVKMLDELGEKLIPDDYAKNYLGYSGRSFWGRHKVRDLTKNELRTLRRDVANHYMRIMEIYGDAFLEAVSRILHLGTYASKKHSDLLTGPFRGYHNLVIFSSGFARLADPETYDEAHQQFLLIKKGGRKSSLFGNSMECIEDMDKKYRRYVIRGKDIVER